MADTSGSTSYPTDPKPGKTQAVDPSLGVAYNGNVFPYTNDPEVLNASPATKKSYSWNRGDVGNGNGPK